MVNECAYLYDTGRTCRRIPRRGETFCPAHRNKAARRNRERELQTEMMAWVERLHQMDIEELLDALNGSLSDIQPLIERKCSRRAYAAFTRATIAVTAALDRLSAAFAGYRAADEQRRRSLSSSPAPAPSTAPAAPAPVRFSLEELTALCERIVTSAG